VPLFRLCRLLPSLHLLTLVVLYLPGTSDKMTRQEKIRDPLPHSVLVPAVPANQLPLHDLCLHEQMMQILERLLVALQLLRSRGLCGQGWETQLYVQSR
jgi:hypothetical protein